MHVLKDIHGWLRPGGVLLDLHPEPEQPTVEVRIDALSNVHLGLIDNTSILANIHRAGATLASIVDEGWFCATHCMVFDFVSRFPSVDEWLRYRQERRSSSIVDPAIVARARELLSAKTSGEVVVSERLLATRLVRIDPLIDQSRSDSLSGAASDGPQPASSNQATA